MLDAGRGTGGRLGARGDVVAEFAGLEGDGGAAAHVGDEGAHRVAEEGRVGVLVEAGVDAEGGGVEAGLVGEGEGADVGGGGARPDAGDGGDGGGRAGEGGELVGGDDGPAAFEDEVGDDGEEVGVAAAFAVAVGGALDVDGAGVGGGEGVGDGAAGVVVAVDAEGGAGGGAGLGDDAAHLVGEVSAVGVAEDDGAGAGLGGGVDDFQGVVRVEPVAVEVVLGVEEDGAAGADEVAHRAADHGEVLGEGGVQGAFHVAGVALADQGDHGRLGDEQGADLGVVGDGDAGAAGGAEGREAGVAEAEFGTGPVEELGVAGDGAGPAALDVVHADGVQETGHGQFLVDREGHALLLAAVAQRGVVQLCAALGHVSRPPLMWAVPPLAADVLVHDDPAAPRSPARRPAEAAGRGGVSRIGAGRGAG